MNRALICVDFINDIIGIRGKLAGKGYRAFAEERGTLQVVGELQRLCRANRTLLIHVRIGFDSRYISHPADSPLFGGAVDFEALQLGTTGTDFVPEAAPDEGEIVLLKPRVSAFYGTSLESTLRTQSVREVLVAGVATDLAVEATARDAHDRDFEVVVVQDACAAATLSDHEHALTTLAKLARITDAADCLL